MGEFLTIPFKSLLRVQIKRAPNSAGSAQPLLLAPQNVSPPGTTGLITETITKVGAAHAFEQSAPHSPITKTLKRSPHSAISMLCVTTPKTKRNERNE